MEFELVHGGLEIYERTEQILTPDEKFREARSSGISEIPDFIDRLDGMWEEFDSLGNPRADYV